MIDAQWNIGHTEPPAGFIFQWSYLIAPYKNVNNVDFPHYNQIYYTFLFILIFIYEGFVVH